MNNSDSHEKNKVQYDSRVDAAKMVELLKNLEISVEAGVPSKEGQDEDRNIMMKKIPEIRYSIEGEESVNKIINQIIENVVEEDYKNDQNYIMEKNAASTITAAAVEDDIKWKFFTKADDDSEKIASPDEDNDNSKIAAGNDGEFDVPPKTLVRFSARLAAKNSILVPPVQMQEEDNQEDILLEEYSWIFSEEDNDMEVDNKDTCSVIEVKNKNVEVNERNIADLRRSPRIAERKSEQQSTKRVRVFKEEQQEKKARMDKKIENRRPWNYGLTGRKRL